MSEFGLKNFGYKPNPTKNFDRNKQQKVLDDLHRQGFIDGPLKADQVFKDVNGQMMIDIKGHQSHLGHIQDVIQKAVKSVDPAASFTQSRMVQMAEHHAPATQPGAQAGIHGVQAGVSPKIDGVVPAKPQGNQAAQSSQSVQSQSQNEHAVQTQVSEQNIDHRLDSFWAANSIGLPTVRGTVMNEVPQDHPQSAHSKLESIIKSGGHVEGSENPGYNNIDNTGDSGAANSNL